MQIAFHRGVNSKMHIQMVPLFELLVAFKTDERLFTGVNLLMIIQFATLFELFDTIRTDKRLFASINTKMAALSEMLTFGA